MYRTFHMRQCPEYRFWNSKRENLRRVCRWDLYEDTKDLNSAPSVLEPKKTSYNSQFTNATTTVVFSIGKMYTQAQITSLDVICGPDQLTWAGLGGLKDHNVPCIYWLYQCISLACCLQAHMRMFRGLEAIYSFVPWRALVLIYIT